MTNPHETALTLEDLRNMLTGVDDCGHPEVQERLHEVRASFALAKQDAENHSALTWGRQPLHVMTAAKARFDETILEVVRLFLGGDDV